MKIVLVDKRLPDEAVRGLMRHGYRAVALPPLSTLPEAIASHPDTLLFHHGKRMITTAEYCDTAAYVFSDIREAVPDVSIDFTSEAHGARYPHDCLLNAAVIGRRLFCRVASIAPAVLRYAESAGLEVVDTRQGYAACATLVLDGEHVITADAGLARLYRSLEIDVLLIESVGISLYPYEYGFIGGAGGVADGKVFFIGDLSTHPSHSEIEKYISGLGMTAVSLCHGVLTDLGGLRFLP